MEEEDYSKNKDLNRKKDKELNRKKRDKMRDYWEFQSMYGLIIVVMEVIVPSLSIQMVLFKGLFPKKNLEHGI